MCNINYRVEAIKVLLNEDCILKRYYPLIPYKSKIVDYLLKNGCLTKDECIMLSDDALIKSGLPDKSSVDLFRRFLRMYDPSKQKFKEINSVCQTVEEEIAFRELYMLPGVKATRAGLYYKAGFHTLTDIAVSSPEEILERTTNIISKEGLQIKAPLLKEIRTHIAVAKAFTVYRVS